MRASLPSMPIGFASRRRGRRRSDRRPVDAGRLPVAAACPRTKRSSLPSTRIAVLTTRRAPRRCDRRFRRPDRVLGDASRPPVDAPRAATRRSSAPAMLGHRRRCRSHLRRCKSPTRRCSVTAVDPGRRLRWSVAPLRSMQRHPRRCNVLAVDANVASGEPRCSPSMRTSSPSTRASRRSKRGAPRRCKRPLRRCSVPAVDRGRHDGRTGMTLASTQGHLGRCERHLGRCSVIADERDRTSVDAPSPPATPIAFRSMQSSFRAMRAAAVEPGRPPPPSASRALA